MEEPQKLKIKIDNSLKEPHFYEKKTGKQLWPKPQKDWEKELENWPLYQVPHLSVRVWGEDKKGNRYEGMAVNPKELLSTTRQEAIEECVGVLEGMIKDLGKKAQVSGSGMSDSKGNDYLLLGNKQALTTATKKLNQLKEK